jgi:hypothetical protein
LLKKPSDRIVVHDRHAVHTDSDYGRRSEDEPAPLKTLKGKPREGDLFVMQLPDDRFLSARTTDAVAKEREKIIKEFLAPKLRDSISVH